MRDSRSILEHGEESCGILCNPIMRESFYGGVLLCEWMPLQEQWETDAFDIRIIKLVIRVVKMCSDNTINLEIKQIYMGRYKKGMCDFGPSVDCRSYSAAT